MYNEIIVFFLIIIFIILLNYDIKYTIIFCILLYLLNKYSNYILNEPSNPFFYNDIVSKLLNDMKKYKNFDIKSYKLGLKYYNYFIKNIKLLKFKKNYTQFISLLENAKVYYEASVNHFDSILFSIDIDDKEYINNFTNLLNSLKKISQDIIRDTENYYNNLELEYNINNENNVYNIFKSNSPLINSFKNYIKPSIYNNIIVEKDIFNRKYIS